jgi:hypothetical protein
MPRRTARRFPDPFLGWGTLGLKTLEMMAASSGVIHHRTNRKNSAAQLFEMGNEKVQAAIEASHAVTRQWMRMGAQPGPAQWAALYASALTPFHARAVANARRARHR